MKRRIGALLLAFFMALPGLALAEELTPVEKLFERGKKALELLAQGEIDQALELIDFVFDVESEQTEEAFREAAWEYLALLDSGMVQTEVALIWLDEMDVWHLGIPLVEPVSWDVEALVLDSRDLEVFCGYSASNWGALEEAAAISEEAHWNIEYQPGRTLLFADE